MPYLIPIVRYVGGEEYERIDREVRAVDATAEQIRAHLCRAYFSELEADFYIQPGKGVSMRRIKERKRMAREYMREVRYFWLHLNRKG